MNREVVVKKEVSIGVGTLAFLILFVLKLLGEIDMSWFWVLTSWIWVPILVLLAALAFMFIFGTIIVILGAIFSR
jgi:ABC-type antimicrobial peptide transport system permease subunit